MTPETKSERVTQAKALLLILNPALEIMEQKSRQLNAQWIQDMKLIQAHGDVNMDIETILEIAVERRNRIRGYIGHTAFLIGHAKNEIKMFSLTEGKEDSNGQK